MFLCEVFNGMSKNIYTMEIKGASFSLKSVFHMLSCRLNSGVATGVQRGNPPPSNADIF